ncbi:hypothetical protein V8B97DRAFT_569552 [Scleroderma yunnanense]
MMTNICGQTSINSFCLQRTHYPTIQIHLPPITKAHLSNHPLTPTQLHLYPSRVRSLYRGHTQLYFHLSSRTNQLGFFLSWREPRLDSLQIRCCMRNKFSWQCATPNTYGPFARIVYDGFNDTYGSWESSCFRFHLQKSALEAFDYGWSTLACQNISPKAEEVDYASRVSCFVAELHAVGLLRRAHIHRCLGRVLNDMHLPEHIHVLWEMVVCGKGTPWQGPGSEQLVADFVHFFNQRTQSILSIASSGHPQLVSAGGQANSIPRMIREWHSQPPMGPVTMEQSIWAYPTS